MAELIAHDPPRAALRTGGFIYDFEGLIDIPDAETSAGWTDSIPTTYDGHGKKAVYWDGHLWALREIQEDQGVLSYIWEKLPDIAGIMEYIDNNYVQSEYVVLSLVKTPKTPLTPPDYSPPEYTYNKLYILEVTPDNLAILRFEGVHPIDRYNVFDRVSGGVFLSENDPPTYYYNEECPFRVGDIYTKTVSVSGWKAAKRFLCTRIRLIKNNNALWDTSVEWTEIPIESYSKSEIDSMIGDIETLLSQI